MKRPIQKLAIVLTAAVLVGATAAWYRARSDENTAGFETAAVTRGDLSITISATGTVEPEEVIDVGAQVAGQILSFGRDVDGRIVDYGSRVAEGTVLARIDDSLYTAEAANAQAQVQAAQAGVQRAEADLFPKFTLNGTIGYQSADAGTLFDWSNHFWSFGPSTLWRLFESGRLRAGVEVQKALQEAEVIAY